jgi:gamma-glutamyltranspeptidase/glutathione hydrolase
VWLASVLNVLSGYELDALDSTTRRHVMLEAMRRAHRDRAQYLGDPAFTDVPVRLLTSPDYAAGLRASIRTDRATPSDALPGTGILLNNQMDDFAVKAGVPNMYGLVGAAAIAAAPRLHHQYRPDAVFAEPGALTPAERAGLEERGHSLRPWPATIGNLQVVTWDRATGGAGAASDPRWGGAAAVRPEGAASAVRPDGAASATP